MGRSPKAKEIKLKISKWGLKLKAFAQQRKPLTKMKRAPTKWEKIFVNYVTNKGLISKIYKQLIKQYQKTQTIQLNNEQKTQIDIFPKKIYRWPTGTWKDAQHDQLLEKCKSKLQGDVTC